MIGRLAGRIVWRGTDLVVIDVGGVGYEVHVSERTLAGLPGLGGAATLWTELVVREDLMQLFGFPTLKEREWHRLLTSVQGIGARAGIAILGALGPDGVGRAIALGDSAAIRAAPGIGAKLATRLVNELSDKAPAIMALPPEPEPDGAADPAPGLVPDRGGHGATADPPRVPPAARDAAASDALSALGNLGYAPAEAARAVAEAARDAPEAGASDLIRAALRRLAPKE